MRYYEKSGDETVMEMVEKTLTQMYRGGLFDHIGGGFSRYSTDRRFLVPHFEKMLYDNALMILACSKAYQLTENTLYRQVAERTADYILREMTSEEGGFYSAQDADSEGVEGQFYLFEPWEVTRVLGEETGMQYNRRYDITEKGNFEGKNILNLLHSDKLDDRFDAYLPALYEYRKGRHSLHLDDKILTSWNALMIRAMCQLYRVTEERRYLDAAIKAQTFLRDRLWEGDTLYVSYRDGKRGGKGFLDEYAAAACAFLSLYEATLDPAYLEDARGLCEKAVSSFFDEKRGGFYLYGEDNEQLILRPKEAYDGAVPSGNSIMAYNLVQLQLLTGGKGYGELARRQQEYMCLQADSYPAGYAVFLMALSDHVDIPDQITIVTKEYPLPSNLSCRIPLNTTIRVLDGPTEEYPLKDGKTTFYVCKGRSCLPPVNSL